MKRKLPSWAVELFQNERENESIKEKEKFGFIKRADKGWITTVKDLES